MVPLTYFNIYICFFYYFNKNNSSLSEFECATVISDIFFIVSFQLLCISHGFLCQGLLPKFEDEIYTLHLSSPIFVCAAQFVFVIIISLIVGYFSFAIHFICLTVSIVYSSMYVYYQRVHGPNRLLTEDAAVKRPILKTYQFEPNEDYKHLPEYMTLRTDYLTSPELITSDNSYRESYPV